MSETQIMKEIQLALSKLGCRIFRCNTGQGWVGKSVRFTKLMMVQVYPGDVIIRQARPLHAGLTEGGSDLIGWTKDGKFLSIETKVEGHKTDKDRLEKQINFIDAVNKSGGVGFIAKNVDEAVQLYKLKMAIY